MKKYTQEDFENFEVNEMGYKICPSGDYSMVNLFGEGCNFGKGCLFEDGCIFGETIEQEVENL